MTRFNRLLMTLFAIVAVSLSAGCGDGSPTTPNGVEPSTQHVVITLTVFDGDPELGLIVRPDASGVWHFPTGNHVCVRADFTNPGNVYFSGTMTLSGTRPDNWNGDNWTGWSRVDSNAGWQTACGLLPKGRQEAVVDITESNGYHQTATAVIIGE